MSPLRSLLILATCGFVLSGSAPYNESFARQMAFYSAATYCGDADVANWTCRFCDGGDAPTLSNVTILWNSTTQIGGFVGLDSRDKRIIVSFRGSRGILDWLEDFDIVPVQVPGCGPGACEVSSGFYTVAYMSVRSQIISAVKGATTLGGRSLHVTGHSLGAALAEIAAWDLAASGMPVTSSVTFGTPRSGNAAWAAAWAAAAPSIAFRITHAHDPVPHLPPREILGFVHSPREVWYPDAGNGTRFIVCSATDGEDPSCSNSILPLSPDDHNLYLNVQIDECKGAF